MKTIKKIVIMVLLINICIGFCGCKNRDNSELKDKVISELGYINIKIIDILNSLNNLTFDNYSIVSKKVKLDEQNQKKQVQSNNFESDGNQDQQQEESSKQESESQDLINTTEMITDAVLMKDRNNIDWNTIKPEIEVLNESWSVVILDLYSLNVKNDTILNFSSKLNTAMQAIKNEDKMVSLMALADLYTSIPQFLEEIGAENNLQKIRKTQSYIINAYCLAEDINNPEINNNVQKAIDIYSEVISDISYTKDKTYKTNKVYVLLNELANSLEIGDSEIFYVKYENLMEEMNYL